VFKTLLKIVGAMAAVAVIVALSLTWVVVRFVQADGPTIIVPAPAILGQAVLALTPAREREIELDFDLTPYREPGLELIRELRGTPDAELFRLDQDGETVVISKQGDRIRIEVDNRDETVKVNAPIAAFEAFLEAYEGKGMRLTQLAGVIRHFDSGKAVEVRTADADVDVWIW
jgi:hypothetical protein